MALEEANAEVKVVELTSEEKVGESTTPEVELTIKSYTQKELDEAVGKGRASTQSQLSLAKVETERIKAEAAQYKAESDLRQAQIDVLTREVNEALADDPERRQAYTSRIANLEREQKLTAREAKTARQAEEAALDANAAMLQREAFKWARETGIPVEELDNLNEAQMAERALRFQISKQPEKTPKFIGGAPSGGGGGSFTREQIENMSFEEYEKLKPQIDAARIAGKIK